MVTIAGTMALVASAMLVVLTIEVVGAMPGRGSWGLWFTWLGIGTSSLAVAVHWRDAIPMPVAVLLLIVACMLWGQYRRIRWAATRGVWW